jgi:cell division protein FtsN
MPAARRRKPVRSTRRSKGTPAWIWLLTGILIGLGLAWYLFSKGLIPQPRVPGEATAEPAGPAARSSEEVAPADPADSRSKYDFFTVLPEMEVYVPEQELSQKSRSQEGLSAEVGAGDSYLLQVGSFRDMDDAEQRKANLALLGIVSRIQTVTVNDATWHRVRVGPVSGARQAEDMRRQLADNGIESMVLKNQ